MYLIIANEIPSIKDDGAEKLTVELASPALVHKYAISRVHTLIFKKETSHFLVDPAMKAIDMPSNVKTITLEKKGLYCVHSPQGLSQFDNVFFYVPDSKTITIYPAPVAILITVFEALRAMRFTTTAIEQFSSLYDVQIKVDEELTKPKVISAAKISNPPDITKA